MSQRERSPEEESGGDVWTGLIRTFFFRKESGLLMMIPTTYVQFFNE